jgi:hypothetical protein
VGSKIHVHPRTFECSTAAQESLFISTAYLKSQKQKVHFEIKRTEDQLVGQSHQNRGKTIRGYRVQRLAHVDYGNLKWKWNAVAVAIARIFFSNLGLKMDIYGKNEGQEARAHVLKVKS